MKMKSAMGFIMLFIMFFCWNIAQGAEKKEGETMQKDNVSLPTVKLFGVKTAQIEYIIKGDFAHGHRTFLFTDWGMRQSDIEQQDGADTKSITIIDANFEYAFATGDKVGYKSKVDHPAWRSDSGLDFSAWMAKNFETQGFISSGKQRVIAGKTCDVMKHVINKMTICVWNGVPLYMETSTPDGKQKGITEAVKVDEHPAIANDAFTVPANIKF